jgi:hypothetical protein
MTDGEYINLGLDVVDGKWILGKRTAKPCPHCGAPPEPTVARNGRAELWHRPFFCCDAAKRYNASMRLIDEVSKEAAAWGANQ